MSELNFDAMDKVKGSVSYPPNLADAKIGNTERDSGMMKKVNVRLKTRERNKEKRTWMCGHKRYKGGSGWQHMIYFCFRCVSVQEIT